MYMATYILHTLSKMNNNYKYIKNFNTLYNKNAESKEE